MVMNFQSTFLILNRIIPKDILKKLIYLKPKYIIKKRQKESEIKKSRKVVK